MEDLAAYIPLDRRHALAKGKNLSDRPVGAALFADVSGFTPLMRAFVGELGSQRGAEALLGVINPVYQALIAPVHLYGGSVISFAGDAITCWLDDTPGQLSPIDPGAASARAVAAALSMQAVMASFAATRTPGGTPVSLSVKIAIAAGPARRFLVGNPALLRMDVLAGTTVARMAAAEGYAERGEIIVSREVVTQVVSLTAL